MASRPQRQAPELSDWVERMARGDTAALRRVYDRLAPPALGLALRMLRTRAEAEEVLQEAFLEIWRRAGEYDVARGQPEAWVTTIVRSRCLDRLRARASSARVAAASAREPEPPPAPSPLEDAERRRERERVLAALAELPADQRDTIELAYYEGLTHSQIAAQTGTPLGTVKTRIKLGIDKLGGLLRGKS